MSVRPPAVAGMFYPSDPTELGATIERCFAAAVDVPADATSPKAIVVPHAGLQYSGPIAASAYRRIAPAASRIHKVVLAGPSHRVPLRGVALSSADSWSTPLGLVPLDTGAAAAIDHLAWVRVDDLPHGPEHCLEVQLPFLQTVLDDFELIPLAVGDTTTDEVASVLDALWGGPETLIVVSTDLSHFHRYVEAAELDARTASAIVALRSDDITELDACGARPLRGLLSAGAHHQLGMEQIDLRNSGDTSGDKKSVVGYGAFALT